MGTRDTFGNKLHRVLSIKGIKQVELAKALDVPPTTLNGWIKGNYIPDIEMLESVCNVLNLSVLELIDGSNVDQIKKTEQVKAVNPAPVEKEKPVEKAHVTTGIIKDLKDAGVRGIRLEF